MFKRILVVLSIVCIFIGVLCMPFASTSFGAIFFVSLGISLLGLAACIKFSTLNNKYAPFFKILAIIGKTLLSIWLISFLIIETLIISGEKSDNDIIFDTIIVLGAGISDDQPSLAFQSRLDTAIDYLNHHPDTIVITTGGYGDGEQYAESYVARKYLIDNGIDQNRILSEDKSTNTFENVRYAHELLPEDYDGLTAAVSNDFHLFRARLLLDINGLTPYAIGTRIPTYDALNVIYSIREYFSVVKHLLFER